MWIMIAGPYSSGTKTKDERASNLTALNEVALLVYEKGHIPIIGVNLALPITELAERKRFDEIMMSISLAAADKCDACLRIGGASVGADQELEKFHQRGLPVFTHIDEIPPSNSSEKL
jgi:hypothetical protein